LPCVGLGMAAGCSTAGADIGTNDSVGVRGGIAGEEDVTSHAEGGMVTGGRVAGADTGGLVDDGSGAAGG